MGRQFVGTSGSRGKLYGCKFCRTFVTSQRELTSPHFNGSTGPAMLFRKVWNVEHGTSEKRKMTTGWHMVRDVFCVLCKSKLGWMYEMAMEADQTYKEGQVILENQLITKISEAIQDPLGEDSSEEQQAPNIEQERKRSASESSLASRSNSESDHSSYSGSVF